MIEARRRKNVVVFIQAILLLPSFKKALWDGQGEIKMYYAMLRVKKKLSGKRSTAQQNHYF